MQSPPHDAYAQPDCDLAPVPVPSGGKTEGADNYACDGGDCHLIVYQGTRLYELYQADIIGGAATGGYTSSYGGAPGAGGGGIAGYGASIMPPGGAAGAYRLPAGFTRRACSPAAPARRARVWPRARIRG